MQGPVQQLFGIEPPVAEQSVMHLQFYHPGRGQTLIVIVVEVFEQHAADHEANRYRRLSDAAEIRGQRPAQKIVHISGWPAGQARVVVGINKIGQQWF